MKVKVSISFFGSCIFSRLGGEMARKFMRLELLDDVDLVPVGDPSATHFVAFDHSARSLKRTQRIVDRTRRMLLIFEPQAVNPSQYRKKNRQDYSLTVVGSRRHLLSPDEVFINHTYLPDSLTLAKEMARRRGDRLGIGILNENKYSFVRGNQYKTRVSAMRRLAKAGFRVTVGGKNWNRNVLWQFTRQLESALACLKMRGEFEVSNFHLTPRSKNLDYVGRVDSEVEFLSKFEFALVVENDPNYVSEKLFNAIRAQAIPIYVGPPLIEFGLPPALAIEVSGFEDSVLKAVEFCTKEEKQLVLKSGREFLNEQLENGSWQEDTSVVQLTRAINDFLRRGQHE